MKENNAYKRINKVVKRKQERKESVDEVFGVWMMTTLKVKSCFEAIAMQNLEVTQWRGNLGC